MPATIPRGPAAQAWVTELVQEGLGPSPERLGEGLREQHEHGVGVVVSLLSLEVCKSGDASGAS